MPRDGPLPTLGVEIGAAKGAACRVGGDSLTALGAIAGMHRARIGPSRMTPLSGPSEVLKKRPDECGPPHGLIETQHARPTATGSLSRDQRNSWGDR